MEASGTSGQKASVNGVLNFSISDGWWAEGYNTKNGWLIGIDEQYMSYEEQDIADSESMYHTLEHKIMPMYYAQDEHGVSTKWIEAMKNSIMSTGGKYSTSRMVVDYVNNLYVPLCNLTNQYYSKLEEVTRLNAWKNEIRNNWNNIKIMQMSNLDNITIDAGNNIEVSCAVELPNIDKENVEVEVYYGKILDNGVVRKMKVIPMKLEEKIEGKENTYLYKAKIELTTGGNYGYTFRVMPKHEMILETANLDLVKWITN